MVNKRCTKPDLDLPTIPLIVDHPFFESLGASLEVRQKAYRALSDALDPADEAMIRQSARNNWPTGSDRFREQIEATLARKLMPGRRGRPRRPAVDAARVNA
jgi:putative transposase